MTTVRVLTTGGTFATRTDAHGRSVARARGSELVDGLDIDDVRIEVEDVCRVGSSLTTWQHVHQLARRTEHAQHDPCTLIGTTTRIGAVSGRRAQSDSPTEYGPVTPFKETMHVFAKPPGWTFAARESVGCGFWAEGRLLGQRRGTVDACLEAHDSKQRAYTRPRTAPRQA